MLHQFGGCGWPAGEGVFLQDLSFVRQRTRWQPLMFAWKAQKLAATGVLSLP